MRVERDTERLNVWPPASHVIRVRTSKPSPIICRVFRDSLAFLTEREVCLIFSENIPDESTLGESCPQS